MVDAEWLMDCILANELQPLPTGRPLLAGPYVPGIPGFREQTGYISGSGFDVSCATLPCASVAGCPRIKSGTCIMTLNAHGVARRCAPRTKKYIAGVTCTGKHSQASVSATCPSWLALQQQGGPSSMLVMHMVEAAGGVADRNRCPSRTSHIVVNAPLTRVRPEMVEAITR